MYFYLNQLNNIYLEHVKNLSKIMSRIPQKATFTLLLLTAFTQVIYGNPIKKCYKKYLQEPAVQRFREYLRIDTSEGINIQCAVDFWKRQAQELNLPISIVKHPGGEPVVVITVEGSDPTLPSILVNSHSDVVPAIESQWLHPPFEAYMDDNGDIYARGAQDTKDVGIQYLEAIRKLKQENCTLLRTIYITVMPDEETGGYKGMKLFLETDKFRSMNVGFALDEGLASTDDTLFALYEDRRPWQMQFIVHGEGGHGFMMPDGSAMTKAQSLINAIMKYRDVEKNVMKSVRKLDYGAYTSLNINILQGGYTANVIPSEISLVVDMRLSADANISSVEDMVKQWLNEAGNGTELNFIRRDDVSLKTKLDENNPYWVIMRETLNNMGYNVVPIVCPATTDMLVLRNKGIPAVGFSAKTHTVPLIHNDNEYLNVEIFMKGIDIYYEIIKALANMPDTTV